MGDLWNRLGEKQKKLFSWLAVVLVIGIGLLGLRPSAAPISVPPAAARGQSYHQALGSGLGEQSELNSRSDAGRRLHASVLDLGEGVPA